tara:strand:+ start:8240 stop:8980 length:741 start_codon:yes stop_codon:yes gene_type:complete
MLIQEVEPEEKITMKKWKFSCDEKTDGIPEPLPNVLRFCMAIIGRAGSGKSSLLMNLVCKRGKLYNKKFDKVIVFSPSLKSMDDCPFDKLPPEQLFSELTIDTLEQVVADITDSEERILIIMDDVVNDMNKNAELQRQLCKLLMNRRHIAGYGGGISVIITSQVYNKIPCAIRKTFSHMILMDIKQKRELDSLWEEHILTDKKQFENICKYCYKDKFDFMYLDLEKPYDEVFHRNFNKLIVDLDRK